MKLYYLVPPLGCLVMSLGLKFDMERIYPSYI